MSLQKDKTLDTGTVANYWKIIRLGVVDFINNICYFDFGLYISEALKSAGNRYTRSYNVSLQGVDFPFGDVLQTTVDAVAIEMPGSHSFGIDLSEIIIPELVADTYDLDVTIDGGALRKLSITISGGENHNAIAALIQTALRTAEGGSLDIVVVVSSPGDYNGFAYKITSELTGATSTVLVVAGTLGSSGGDLLAALNLSVNSQVTGGTKINIEDLIRTLLYNKVKTMSDVKLDGAEPIDFTTALDV